MARAGIFVDCEILENKDYGFCIYSVNQKVIMRDDLPLPNPGHILIVVDTIIPTIRNQMRNIPYNVKGILVYNDKKKEEQERYELKK